MSTLLAVTRPTDDREHLAAVAASARMGDAEAVDEHLRLLSPVVVRTTRLIVGPGLPAAEDAAQEALLDISRAMQQLRAPEAVLSWAIRIATARALRVAGKERSLAGLVRRTADAADPTAGIPGQDEDLRTAFYELPPRLRAVAILRLYRGFSERETAEALGCSVGTVKSQLHDARARLRKRLGD